jgi:Kinesin motor domain
MQIYNEKIYDLLQDKRRENPLVLRESGRGASSTVHVQGLSIYRVYSKEDVIVLLGKGLRNRAIRATDFNQESSRSHTILQLFVQVEEEDANGLMVLKRSTFSLVDLAGSEKWRPVITILSATEVASHTFPPPVLIDTYTYVAAAVYRH